MHYTSSVKAKLSMAFCKIFYGIQQHWAIKYTPLLLLTITPFEQYSIFPLSNSAYILICAFLSHNSIKLLTTSKTTFNNDQQGKTALSKTGKWVDGVVEVVGFVGVVEVVGMDWDPIIGWLGWLGWLGW